MERRITLEGHEIFYTQKVGRGRGVRIAIKHGGVVTVTAPRFVLQASIERFMQSKAQWIIKKYLQLKKFPAPLPKAMQRRSYMAHKETARAIAHERAEHFNKYYRFSYNSIAIRNQKTRWGSCSKKGNLNFSYKIALIRPELVDYIVVHELCHLREFNHSSRFWDLVAETVPNHKALRKELKGDVA